MSTSASAAFVSTFSRLHKHLVLTGTNFDAIAMKATVAFARTSQKILLIADASPAAATCVPPLHAIRGIPHAIAVLRIYLFHVLTARLPRVDD